VTLISSNVTTVVAKQPIRKQQGLRSRNFFDKFPRQAGDHLSRAILITVTVKVVSLFDKNDHRKKYILYFPAISTRDYKLTQKYRYEAATARTQNLGPVGASCH
jgi:hypothetical protein